MLSLHPVNTAAAVWDRVGGELGRPAAALDYRGHGVSDPGASYLPADFAADALAVLDHLGWERVHLAGGSIGGAVAVEIAARIPGRIASIAAFGATLRIGLSADEVAPLLDGLRTLGVDETFRQHGAQIVGPKSLPGVGERFVELGGGRDPDVVAEIVRTTFCRADSRPAAAVLGNRLPPVPALVAVGTDDPTCPMAMAEELAGHFGAPVTVLDGIGHLPMLEAPEQVVALLTTHWRTTDRRTMATELHPIAEPRYVGPAEDIEAIRVAHRDWWAANNTVDNNGRETVERAARNFAPGTLMFNLNGHTYYGLDEMRRAWEYYVGAIEIEVCYLWDYRIHVEGDLAYLTCEGVFPTKAATEEGWKASNIEIGEAAGAPVGVRFRETSIARRDDGEGNKVWKLWHFHCSPSAPADEVRPGIGDTATERGDARGGAVAQTAEQPAPTV